MAVSKSEFLWREWFLGRERFKGDPRNYARREVTGAPKKIPAAWWKRLEAWLSRSSDYSEPGRKSDHPPVPTAPAKPGQLTAHFNVREFACKDGTPVPAAAVPAVKALCQRFLEPMRATFGPAIIVSGYRHRAYNARIGGARFSQHIYDETPASVAADVVFRLGTPAEWARFADQLGAGGVGRYDRSGFVHVDNRPERARWSG